LLVEALFRWWIPSHGDGLQRAMQILIPDQELGWRQRPWFHARFEGHEVVTDAEGFRNSGSYGKEVAVVLGPSSAFGWGVGQTETYAARLGETWSRKLSRPVRVLNAGEIGYSLYQGALLYRSLRDRGMLGKPKYVLLAYGINDLDRFRFVGSSGMPDEEYFASGGARISWPLFLFRFAAGQLLYRSWQESSVFRDCGLEKYPRLRVPPEEFSARLESLAELIRQDGAIPVLLNTAFYPSRPSGDPDASSRLYEESVRASDAGECRRSRNLLRAAKREEVSRIVRDVRVLNQEIKRLASRKGLPMIDLESLLADQEGKKNFFDPVHPSVLGHEKIAEAIAVKLPLPR
jgi:lysophospholipase L1-like esterase